VLLERKALSGEVKQTDQSPERDQQRRERHGDLKAGHCPAFLLALSPNRVGGHRKMPHNGAREWPNNVSWKVA
jgi:hypothetical protein